MYVALMDVISELRNPPPPCTQCLAKLLWDDVITFIKIEPTDGVGPLLRDARFSLQSGKCKNAGCPIKKS